MQMNLANEAETERLGARLFGALSGTPAWIYLSGPLGAGKTTLVRGFLRAAGFAGAVKSPTFTLVEEYALPTATVAHFDLYRLRSRDELEALGIRDYFDGGRFCFIEWPERGLGVLPNADLEITLSLESPGRLACLAATGPVGQLVLESFEYAVGPW